MERDEQCQQDQVFVDQEQLKRLAQEIATPFYLYDKEGLSRTLEQAKECLSWNDNNTIWMNIHCCPSDATVEFLFQRGCGVICSDAGDLARVKRLGLRGRRVLYGPMVPRRNELELVVALEATLAIDSLAMADFLVESGLVPHQLQLRYNPGGKLMAGSRTMAKPSRSKLGMDKATLLQAVRRLKKVPTSIWSLGMEIGTFIGDGQYYSVVLKELWSIKAEVEQMGRLPITDCYLGDALGEGERLTAQNVGATTANMVETLGIPKDVSIGYGLSRLLLAEHCILISKILLTKELQRPMLILDAVRADVPAVVQSLDIYISLVGNMETAGRKFYTVVGQSASIKDVFAKRKLLPSATVGQYCALHHVGYHVKPLPSGYGAYLCDGDGHLCDEHMGG